MSAETPQEESRRLRAMLFDAMREDEEMKQPMTGIERYRRDLGLSLSDEITGRNREAGKRRDE